MKNLMMKFLAAGYLLSIIFISSVFPQTPDEILQRHFEVVGQNKLNKVSTIKMTGDLLQGNVSMDILMLMKRPEKIYIEGKIDRISFIRAFNGEQGWEINPFRGETEPRVLTSSEVNELNETGNFNGMLYNFFQNEYSMELIENDSEYFEEAFLLKVTKPDNTFMIFVIDPESFVVLRIMLIKNVNGVNKDFEVVLGDYKYVDDILFPFSVELLSDGQSVMQYHFNDIILDAEIDDKVFEMPGTD